MVEHKMKEILHEFDTQINEEFNALIINHVTNGNIMGYQYHLPTRL